MEAFFIALTALLVSIAPLAISCMWAITITLWFTLALAAIYVVIFLIASLQ